MSTSGGASSYSRVPAGSTFWFAGAGAGSTSNAQANQQVLVAPFYLGNALQVTQLGVKVAVVGDAGCTLTPVVYADNGAGAPGVLALSGPALPGDAVATPYGAAVGTLQPGWYWSGALLLGVTTTAPTVAVAVPSASDFPTGGVVIGSSPNTAYLARVGQAAVPNPFGVGVPAGIAVAVTGKT